MSLFSKVCRFASIPKCGSRSLLALGLLGEVPGQYHSGVKAYPQWWKYKWFEVTRPDAEWYASWWNEQRKGVEYLSEMLCIRKSELRPEGMQFVDMAADLALLADPNTLASLPERMHVNAWLPDDCVAQYARALDQGKDFKTYCIETILCGMPTVQIPLSELDDFLSSHGYTPVHENPEVEHAIS